MSSFVDSLGADGTLLDFADALVRHIERNSTETRNFDALEIEAVALPGHPAHDYYLHQVERPLRPAVASTRSRTR
ncbi:hypothetical protein [Microbacterium sp. 18062]|uniref:hypothetical protein n=1 Tax=Microbacterium sp. 18062 TaxID=2681410 RepID=UPI00135BAE45|nr:hypothetical protein [Microbacterium sp. 18062]